MKAEFLFICVHQEEVLKCDMRIDRKAKSELVQMTRFFHQESSEGISMYLNFVFIRMFFEQKDNVS